MGNCVCAGVFALFSALGELGRRWTKGKEERREGGREGV